MYSLVSKLRSSEAEPRRPCETDATQRPVEVSPMVEATALGAGFLAGVATGTWDSVESLEGTWRPRFTVEPRPGTAGARERWLDARGRSRNWFPDLSALDF